VVEADERPDEQPEAMGLFFGSGDDFGVSRPAINQHLLQGLKIVWR
jgi:hypothetical protein